MKDLKFHLYYIIKLTCTVSCIYILSFIVIQYRKKTLLSEVGVNFDSRSISLTQLD